MPNINFWKACYYNEQAFYYLSGALSLIFLFNKLLFELGFYRLAYRNYEGPQNSAYYCQYLHYLQSLTIEHNSKQSQPQWVSRHKRLACTTLTISYAHTHKLYAEVTQDTTSTTIE